MTVRYIPLESKSGFKSPGFLVTPEGDVTGKGLVLTENLDVQNITLSGVELISGADSTISLGDGIRHSYLEKLGTLQYLNIDGDFTVSQSSTPYISVVNGEIKITNPQYLTTQIYENITQTLSGTVNYTGGSGATFKVTRTDGTYSVVVTNPGINFQEEDYIIIPGTFLGGETPTNNLRINIVSVLPSPIDQSGINLIQAVGTAVSESHGSMNNVDVGLTVPAMGKFTDVVSTGDLTVADDTTIGGDATITGNITASGNVTATGTGQFDSVRVETEPTEDYHVTRKDYVDRKISAFSIAFGG